MIMCWLEKEFWKSVNIRRSYDVKQSGCFFWNTVYAKRIPSRRGIKTEFSTLKSQLRIRSLLKLLVAYFSKSSRNCPASDFYIGEIWWLPCMWLKDRLCDSQGRRVNERVTIKWYTCDRQLCGRGLRRSVDCNRDYVTEIWSTSYSWSQSVVTATL